MNTSDSEEDSYNERSALVPSENPVVPSYRPGPGLAPPSAPPSKQVNPLTLPCGPTVFTACDPPSRWLRTGGRGLLSLGRTRRWRWMRRS